MYVVSQSLTLLNNRDLVPTAWPEKSFSSVEKAREFSQSALCFEAFQRLSKPIQKPLDPHLHPVDLHTDTPGVVLKTQDSESGRFMVKKYKNVPLGFYDFKQHERPAFARSRMTQNKESQDTQHPSHGVSRRAKKECSEDEKEQKQALKREKAKEYRAKKKDLEKHLSP
eukprot:6193519-Pleurochrysis_carterae.AAC.7